jgi:hypothetical protein
MNIVAERNLFVNTSSVPVGNGIDVSINLPQGYMDCTFGEQMRVTLSSFLMEKKFYDVNETNNTFFVVARPRDEEVRHMVPIPITIPKGNYRAFGGYQLTDKNKVYYDENSLCYAILLQLETAFGVTWNATTQTYEDIVDEGLYEIGGVIPTGIQRNFLKVEYDNITGLITITFDPAALGAGAEINPRDNLTSGPFTFYFFSFELSQMPINNIASDILAGQTQFSFLDTHELLGGCSVQSTKFLQSPPALSDLDTMTKLFNVQEVISPGVLTGGFIATGLFQASLKTLEAVYVRTNLSSSNFQTASFDSGGNLYPFVISSDILAKIPVMTETIPTASKSYVPIVAAVEPPAPPVVNATMTFGSSDLFTFPAEYISFIDQGGHTFSMMLNTNHVSNIRIFLTDDKGRILPHESEEQKKCNELYFTATLKVQVSKPI